MLWGLGCFRVRVFGGLEFVWVSHSTLSDRVHMATPRVHLRHKPRAHLRRKPRVHLRRRAHQRERERERERGGEGGEGGRGRHMQHTTSFSSLRCHLPSSLPYACIHTYIHTYNMRGKWLAAVALLSLSWNDLGDSLLASCLGIMGCHFLPHLRRKDYLACILYQMYRYCGMIYVHMALFPMYIPMPAFFIFLSCNQCQCC